MNVNVLQRELVDITEKLAASDHSLFYYDEGIILASALPSARKIDDVAVISIGNVLKKLNPEVARMVLTALRFDPEILSIGVIRYSPEIIQVCREMLYEICFFDRLREPPGGTSIDWGIAFCSEKKEGIPDIIYDTGAPGKDGLIRVLGENPTLVSGSINRILTRIMNTNL